MSKISIKGLKPGKKYKMVISAETDIGDIQSFPSIDFIVPDAPVAASVEKLSIKEESYQITDNITKKTITKKRLLIYIPNNIISNLIWKDTVRDVVHIVYRTANTKDLALDKSRQYLIGAATVAGDVPKTMTFSENTWTYGHPKIFKFNDVSSSKYYSFQFMIARYIKNTDGTWTGAWIQPFQSDIDKMCSQAVKWGS